MGGLSHCASFGKGPEMCRFSAAGMMVYRHAETAGGRKAPRHEIAGVEAGAAAPALWGFRRELRIGCGELSRQHEVFWPVGGGWGKARRGTRGLHDEIMYF
jgi:hypothetical protein